MLLFLIQSSPTSFVSLGPWGTLLLTTLAVILAVISWRQRTWKSAADAAVAEMGVVNKSCDRLREENRVSIIENTELKGQITNLKNQTDLKPLIISVNDWVLEGRKRFESAEVQLSANTEALKSMVEELKAQRQSSEANYNTINTAFLAHALDDRDYQIRFVTMLDSVERRLSDIAVQVGMPKWSPQPPVSARSPLNTEKTS